MNLWNFLDDPVLHLVGGPVDYIGRVEVYDRKSDQWGTICFNDFISSFIRYEIASLVCSSFGRQFHTFGPASLSSNIQNSTNNPIVSGSIDCNTVQSYSGFYDYFYQCSSFPLNSTEAMSRCTPDQELVVVCRCT